MVTSIRKAALTRPKSLISTGEDRRAQIILDSNAHDPSFSKRGIYFGRPEGAMESSETR
jgi:hypothetical protein